MKWNVNTPLFDLTQSFRGCLSNACLHGYDAKRCYGCSCKVSFCTLTFFWGAESISAFVLFVPNEGEVMLLLFCYNCLNETQKI